MIYHVLIMVNHQPYGLLVQTDNDKPHPRVLRSSELAAEVTDYRKVRVWSDRGGFFAPQHTGGPYSESALLQWCERGCSALDWPKVLARQPI